VSDSEVTLGFLTHVEQPGSLREGASRVPALAPMRPSTPGGRAPGGGPRRSSDAGGGVLGGLGGQAASGSSGARRVLPGASHLNSQPPKYRVRPAPPVFTRKAGHPKRRCHK
jgi:hypothetical protein